MCKTAGSTSASARTPIAIAVPARITNDPITIGRYKSASADQWRYHSYLLDALSWSRLQAFIRQSRYSVPLGLLCSTKLRLRACDK